MMMRLIGVAVVGVGLLGSSATQRPASAILCANCAQELTQQLSWGQNWVEMGKQLDEARKLFNVATSDYNQAMTVWNAATRVTDLGSAVGALGVLGIQNPLPVNPYALQNLLNGTGGVQGGVGSLTSLFSGTQTINSVYTVQPGSFARDEMIRQASAYSGSQSIALQLHDSAAQRSPLIAQLQARLAGQTDPNERERIAAELGGQTAQIANQQVQATAALAYQSAQTRVDELREKERLQKSIDEALIVLDGRSAGGGSGPIMMARGS